MVQNLPANAWDTGDMGLILGQEDPLEEQMATHSSILAWRILWTEELGGLQSSGLQTVRHNLETKQQQIIDCSHHAILYISMRELFIFNWKFTPFDPLHPFIWPPWWLRGESVKLQGGRARSIYPLLSLHLWQPPSLHLWVWIFCLFLIPHVSEVIWYLSLSGVFHLA